MSGKLITAKLRRLRIAPRKVRLVTDLIRGKYVDEAFIQLKFLNKKSAEPVMKLLKSAVSNAWHNFKVSPDYLFISKLIVDEGPKFKRWMPRARGRASEIQKKTSHITIYLEERRNLNRKLKSRVFDKIGKKEIKVEESKGPKDNKKEDRKDKLINKLSPKNIISLSKKFFRRKSI